MKKIVSLLTAVTTVLNISVLNTFAASSVLSDKQADVIVSMGFMESIEKNTYLTREKYAKTMILCFGYGGSEIGSSAMSTVDTQEDIMKLAASMELIGLNDDGSFNAQGYATYSEAVRGLVTLLGYDAELKYMGGDPECYIKKANSLKITSGVNKKFDDYISEEEFAKMIYNCLDLPVMMTEFNNVTLKINTYKGDTFLSKRHDVYYGRGIVLANEYTTLSTGSGLTEGTVQINDDIYNLGNTNCDELLGYQVEFYYRDDDGEYTLIWAYADSNKNEELYIEDDNIEGFNNGMYSYSVDKKTKKAKLSASVSYIYNGKAARFSDIPSMKPENGDVTLIDYNKDGSFDVVSIMDYVISQVSDVNTSDLVISSDGVKNKGYRYDFEDFEDVIIYDSKFERSSIGQIKPDDIIWTATDLNNTLLTVVYSRDTVEGKVMGVANTSNERRTVQLESGKYGLAFDIGIKSGESGTFYLDPAGRIAAYEGVKLDYQIGWITGAYISDEDETLHVRIFTGTVKDYPCSEKLTYNGEKVENMTAVGADSEIVLGEKALIAALKNGNEKVEGQIIRFKLNSDLECVFLQTATSTYTENDRLFIEGSIPKEGVGVGCLFKKKLGNLFTNAFALEDDCRVFIIPSDRENYDKYIMGGPELFADDGTTFGVTAYKLNPDDDKCCAAIYDKSADEGASATTKKASVIKSVNPALMADDEPGYEINYYELSIAPASFVEKTAYTDEESYVEGLESGDFVRIDADEDNMVTGFTRIYSASEKKFIHGISAQWGADFRGNGGTVTQKLKNSMKFSVSSSYAAYLTVEYLPFEFCAIYVSTQGKNGKREFRVGSKSDINVGDTIVYCSRVGQEFRVVVYK